MLKQRRHRESVFACFQHITIIFRHKFYYCHTESTVFKPLVVFKLKIFFPKERGGAVKHNNNGVLTAKTDH